MPMPMPAEIPAFARGPEAFAAQGPPMPPAAPVRNPRRGPFRRRMSRGLRRSADLQAAEARTRAALALPVSTCRRIAVVSVRGGAGKTTLAALLGMALAEHREDRVLAVDADAVLGSLPMRLGMAAARSLHDLAAARRQSWEDSSAYLMHAGPRLWVLPGTVDGRLIRAACRRGILFIAVGYRTNSG
jgi:Mrp family chromosome partitioning ATPase